MPGKTLRRLMGLLRPFWRGMALAAMLSVLTIAASVGLMATSAWMISKAGLQPSIAELGVSVVAVRFFGITRGGFRYLERLVSHDTTFRLLADLRVQFYRAIEPLAPARLSQYASGDLLARVVGDVDALQNIYLRAVAPPLVALITGGLLTLLFAAFDGLVALTALLCLGTAALATILLAWHLGRGTGQTMTQQRAELNAELVDNLQGMADWIAFGQTDRRLEALNQQIVAIAAHERRYARLEGMQAALALLLANGAMLAVLTVAIPRVEGIFLATLALATLAAYEAILPLAQAATYLSASLESASRLFDLADQTPAITNPESPAALPAEFDLTIQNLAFSYAPDGPPLFRQLNLTLPSGQVAAILGESGAGKSTLTQLLVRFYDYAPGQIIIGGTELRSLAEDDARRIFSVMSQRTHLFNTTIRENIRIARPDASDEAVEAAAQAAQIHEFIVGLPEGYDTFAGEDGARVSGGERQRIALARALLRDTPILILDEATAHLDAATERAVFDTIRHTCQGRTILILTHQVRLLDAVDAVYMLANGALHPLKRAKPDSEAAS